MDLNKKQIIRNRYEIQKSLNKGGFSNTFLALDLKNNNNCVLKSFNLKKTVAHKAYALFTNEAKILENLQHPHIPDFIDFFTLDAGEETGIYLVQEYIEGKNLFELIQSGKHFEEKEAINFLLHLINILEYLHNFSPPIIHKDIKPQNIIVKNDGRPVLIDFGAARESIIHVEMENQGLSTIIGTQGYMPLEQFEGRTVVASDLYSLGMTMIFALSHKEPFMLEKDGLKVKFESAVNISPAFSRLLGKMIEADLNYRYKNIEEVKKDLLSLKSGNKIYYLKPGKLTLNNYLVMVLALLFSILATYYLKLSSEYQQKINKPTQTRQTKYVEEPKTKEIIPFQGEEYTVKGKLLFDGTRIDQFTSVTPNFWIRNENTNKEQKTQVVYQNGVLLIKQIPAGKYGMNVTINANPNNYTNYPGDYYGWKTFNVEENANNEIEVTMRQAIHLLKPQDNELLMEDWGPECPDKKTLTSPVNFAWEKLAGEVAYIYSITRIKCPYTNPQTLLEGSITENEIKFDLLPNQENEFYLLRLRASHNNTNIGVLMSHFKNGLAWDYRFRVK